MNPVRPRSAAGRPEGDAPTPGAVTVAFLLSEGGRLVCVTRLGLTVRAADTGRTLYSERLVDPARYEVDEESDLPAPSAAVVRDGRIHVSQGEVPALDALSGETLWRWGAEEPSTWPGGPVYGAPAVQDGVVYVVAAPEDTGARPSRGLGG